MHIVEEKEFLDLIRRHMPNAEASWVGASEEEIEEIEEIAGEALPDFYRWFLRTMGQEVGRLLSPVLDFTAKGVLSAYESALSPYEQGLFVPKPGILFVGRFTKKSMPTLYFYDLAKRTADDARVIARLEQGGDAYAMAGSLRELVTYNVMRRALRKLGVSCLSSSTRSLQPRDSLAPSRRDLALACSKGRMRSSFVRLHPMMTSTNPTSSSI